MSARIFLCSLLCLGLLLPVVARPKLDEVRDPFVFSVEPETPEILDRPTPEDLQRPRPPEPQQQKVTLVPSAPEATVSGIVAGQQMQALITFEGETLLVSVGDKLGAFTVKSIDDRRVTLSNQGHRFSLKMNSEY